MCKFFYYFRHHKSSIMKKWIFFPLFVILLSCKGKNRETYFTSEKASGYFKDIDEICNRDSGKLWGTNLYGPIMFVDRTSRRIVANQPDNEGLLKEKDGIYTGLYPKELIISNTPVKFGGILFAMVPLPPEEDTFRIKTRAIHSLFHRLPGESGNLNIHFQCTQYG